MSFVLLLCAAVAAYSQSTGAITGKVVVDASGDPLHHVTILVIPLGRTVQTNNEGLFKLEGVPPGKYELVAHMHALTDERKSIVVTAGQTAVVDFRLKVAAVREQVTVTASGREETTLETMQSATSLDTTDLTSQTATSLGDVIENQAGLAKRSSGPGTSRPVIRGFDGDRVLILQDGVRSGTLSSQSGDHGEPIDPNSIERVEVLRGPATLLYEGNAIGGVVNVISGHHEVHREPHDGLRGFITALGGTNNNRRGASAGFEYGLRNWLLFGNGGAIYQDPYHTPLGEVLNSQSNIRDASAGLGRYGEKFFFNGSYAAQDGLYGIPLDPASSHEGRTTLPFRKHNVRLNGGVKKLGSVAELFQLSLNYSDWHHDEKDNGVVANQFFNKQFVYRGVFEQKRVGKLSGSFGFWGLKRDYKAIGEEALTPPVGQDAIAFFGVEQYNFEKFRLQFGARVEHNKYDPRGLSGRSFTGVATSIGANVPLWKGGAFVASYSSAFRSPALEELYNYGPHAGNVTFEIGDINLRRERGNGLDLSLRQQNSRVRAEANFFYYRLSNYVFLAPTGEVNDGLVVGQYRQGASRYRGFEGRLSTAVHSSVWLHAGLDAVNAELIPALPLPRIPPLRGRIGLEFRRGSFSIAPEWIVVNRQDRVYTNETPTAGYGTLNLKALYSVTSKHFLHLLGFNLTNANDALYRNHLSFIKGFAPEMGRAALFTYTVRFF
ncbi:MAG TPA: TonB-dependent receptor [Bryobacteraceae bacterium]|nr:TonB-dependent receptor [Bryobacteraceae bacterium]